MERTMKKLPHLMCKILPRIIFLTFDLPASYCLHNRKTKRESSKKKKGAKECSLKYTTKSCKIISPPQPLSTFQANKSPKQLKKSVKIQQYTRQLFISLFDTSRSNQMLLVSYCLFLFIPE